MSDLREQIGGLIRERRMEKGLSQEALARKLGVVRKTVGQYEIGEQNFTLDTLQKIADALKVKLIIMLE